MHKFKKRIVQCEMRMQLGVSALNANADELRVGKMLQDGFRSASVDWNGSFFWKCR